MHLVNERRVKDEVIGQRFAFFALEVSMSMSGNLEKG